MNCEKCDQGKTYEWAERSQLVGGFHTRLCAKCLNLWHEYVTSLLLWTERETLINLGSDIVIAAYGKEKPTEKLAQIRARLVQLDREFYEIGKAWVSGDNKRTESTPTVDAVDPSDGSAGTLTTRV